MTGGRKLHLRQGARVVAETQGGVNLTNRSGPWSRRRGRTSVTVRRPQNFRAKRQWRFEAVSQTDAAETLNVSRRAVQRAAGVEAARASDAQLARATPLGRPLKAEDAAEADVTATARSTWRKR
jgi:predicted DNA-binding protein (UPF0251 family)